MFEEVNKRNMRNNIFSHKVCQAMLQTLNTRIGRAFDMKQIKQKFNRLRQNMLHFLTCTTNWIWMGCRN